MQPDQTALNITKEKYKKALRNTTIILSILLISQFYTITKFPRPTFYEFLDEIVTVTIVSIAILIFLIRNRNDSIILYSAFFCYLLLIIEDFAQCYKYLGLRSTSTNQIIYSGFKSIYFSIITITTVGYGDFIPPNNICRAISGFEALIGYFLLAVFIAKLISVFR